MDDDVHPQPEQVSISSNLAGYHYETDVGHYTTFFWQTASKVLHASTFLKRDPSWVPIRKFSVRVASNAKKDTPIAAVNWLNGLHAAIYYLDERNIIHERLSSDGGKTWIDGSLTASLPVATRSFSDLAATISWDPCDSANEICLYFQDSRNLIRELRFSINDSGSHWYKGMEVACNEMFAMGGTKIACGALWGRLHVVVQDVGGGVKEFWRNSKKSSNSDANRWSPCSADYLKKSFDRNVPLGYTSEALARQQKFYAYDNGTVIERIWHMNTHWFDPTTLPTGTGTSKILPNFIVLNWARDKHITSEEVHIFSVDTEFGVLWDYVVGTGHPVSVRLV